MKSLNNFKTYLLSLFFWFILNPSYCNANDLLLEINLKSEELKNFTFIQKKENRDTEFYIFEADDQYLQIEKIAGLKEPSAKILIEDDIVSIKAIYANSLSAYPGDLSNEIVCNEKYLPNYHNKIIKEHTYTYAIMYSSARFGLGACTADGVKFKHLRGWLYCKNKKELYTIKYYAPINTKTETLEKLFFSFAERF